MLIELKVSASVTQAPMNSVPPTLVPPIHSSKSEKGEKSAKNMYKALIQLFVCRVVNSIQVYVLDSTSLSLSLSHLKLAYFLTYGPTSFTLAITISAFLAIVSQSPF